jgi:hypothetical protein
MRHFLSAAVSLVWMHLARRLERRGTLMTGTAIPAPAQ